MDQTAMPNEAMTWKLLGVRSKIQFPTISAVMFFVCSATPAPFATSISRRKEMSAPCEWDASGSSSGAHVSLPHIVSPPLE